VSEHPTQLNAGVEVEQEFKALLLAVQGGEFHPATVLQVQLILAPIPGNAVSVGVPISHWVKGA
jgi:hypothetical protein